MSGASQATHPGVARVVRKVDDDMGNWLKDLITGEGSSPSHIIVTGILGVVPGVGQAMDARDMILAIIQIAKTPAAVGGWVELVITLVGCVPAVGDSLKVGFKFMTKGHNFGRVLETVSLNCAAMLKNTCAKSTGPTWRRIAKAFLAKLLARSSTEWTTGSSKRSLAAKK